MCRMARQFLSLGLSRKRGAFAVANYLNKYLDEESKTQVVSPMRSFSALSRREREEKEGVLSNPFFSSAAFARGDPLSARGE